MQPPAHAFWLVMQIHPFLGRSSRLPYVGSYFHVSRCMSLPRQLESLLCSHLLVHFVLSYRFIPKSGPKLTLGRSSRLPCFGSEVHVSRCMSLPIQLESLLRGHLPVHFVTSYRSILELCPKQILGRSSRWPCFGSYFHFCRCMSLPTQQESF